MLNELQTAISLPRVVTPSGLSTLAQTSARRQCEAHITRFYPLHEQINTLRAGDADAIAKMGTFIDACRAWSNDAEPDAAVLEAMTP